MTHTQGPWKMTLRANTIGTYAQICGKDWHICNMPTTTDRVEEMLANALLIATAPELLDALKVLVFTPSIRRWLEENDPKALEQAEKALSRTVD